MKLLERAILAIATCLVIALPTQAETVVVVDAKSGIDQLSRDDVINIFLGRHRKLPTGQLAEPFDLPEDSKLRADFYARLVDKTIPEINAYWARLIFSGKANRPRVGASPQDVLNAVAGRANAIAYVDRTQVDQRVRIVMSLGM